jgi:phosphoribosylaminoimidazolecarboxamide formyltransferase/IMP cyclohydrolase
MSENLQLKKIRKALISVYHKEGLEEIVNELNNSGVEIISTGGTYDFLRSRGIPVTAVEEITGYPSVFGGRVKTLHPKVFGGILYRRDLENDLAQRDEFNIPDIDLVIVDLYPFEEYVAANAEHQAIIEKIDIGGISLIRAAAKNYKDVIIVPCSEEYGKLLEVLKEHGCASTLAEREYFAAKAFLTSSHYDTMIFDYFNRGFNFPVFDKSITQTMHLRYGENPHQQAGFYGDFDAMFTKLHGKEISYNNLLDIDAAVNLINDFDEPTFAVLKHNNACGIASRPTIEEAWDAALACDPVSAFGGVLIANGGIDVATAEKINKIFFEVIMAPAYDEEALKILQSKKNRIILLAKDLTLPNIKYRTALNGILAQEADSKVECMADFKQATNKAVTTQQAEDLIFANKIVKHSKSNAIVLAKNKQLCASGIGQTSRVDSLKQAITKANSFEFDLNGAVMASDAFFPFADCIEIAHNAGIDAVIQPGGSVRDQDTIDYCNEHDIAMVITGFRHFKH